MSSERDGWGHLYRLGRDGTLKHQMERGAYRVSAIKRIDGAAKQIYFSAHGVEPGLPYHARLYRVNFDGTGMTLLTPEPGNHTIRPISFDTCSARRRRRTL